jgi:uncharacterized protein (DUF58 family)
LPVGKAPSYIGLVMALLILTILSRDSSLAVLALPLLAIIFLASLIKPRDTPLLSVHRQIEPSTLTSITPVKVKLTISNASKNAVRGLEIEDQLPPSLKVVAGSNRSLMDLKANCSFELHYEIVPPSRGLYTIGPARTQLADPVKLFISEATIGEPDSFQVYPELLPVKVNIHPHKTGAWRGLAPSRRAGVGMEFHGVRDYQPGDEMRNINWKATARLARIVTNEYETERAIDSVLILDAARISGTIIGPKSILDYEADAALSLASFLLNAGNRVGLILHGHFRHWLYPGFGRRQYLKLREQLTLAQEGDSEIPLRFLVSQLAPMILSHGSQIILVGHLFSTGLPEAVTTLQSLDYQVTAVLVQPYRGKDETMTSASLAGRVALLETEESTSTVERLCPTAYWRVDESLDRALRRLNPWILRPEVFAQ